MSLIADLVEADPLPSELLAEMLRLCPRGQENNAFFNCLFLDKLPRELRILLSKADMADKQALGRQRQQTAGVPQADARGPGQDGDQAVPLPLLLQSQGKVMPGSLHLVRKLGGPGRSGAAQRRRRRAADPHAGPDIKQAFPRGYRCLLQHPFTSFFFACRGSQAVWPGRSAHSLLGRPPGAAAIPGLGFFLEISFDRCCFSILEVDFLTAHKLLIDPDGHALLDSTGRRFVKQLRRSPTTATVVTGFVQLYKPMAETPSSAHTTRAARAGAATAGAAIAIAASARAASAGAASAGAASAGAASAGAASAEPASKQNPTQLRAAYSRLLKEFPAAQTGD